ncbi:MAG TPA: DUF2946 family protein [Trinickia sp.]|jgi:hypothetical protein|nr:DUF2946 family protein [Trinickia sp.]
MDDIVKAALAKWPNVPHCTGWLLLDRRGQWRMRDERAQARGELGAAVRHVALIGFINRNYECDERGQWFFQNGPQRVYVELAYAPWVVRLTLTGADGERTLTLADQTGAAFEPASALIDEEGAVLLVDTATPARMALLHDHDLDLFSDFATLACDGTAGCFHWRAGCDLPIATIARAEVPARFGFVLSPAAASAGT